MFDLTDLLVYADWVEDQGKDTSLLRDTLTDFEYILNIYKNCKAYVFIVNENNYDYYFADGTITDAKNCKSDYGNPDDEDGNGDGAGFPIGGNYDGTGEELYGDGIK